MKRKGLLFPGISGAPGGEAAAGASSQNPAGGLAARAPHHPASGTWAPRGGEAGGCVLATRAGPLLGKSMEPVRGQRPTRGTPRKHSAAVKDMPLVAKSSQRGASEHVA